MAPVLGYWNIRGLATPIRLLLEQAGVEYDEKLYVCGPPPEFDRSNWADEKYTLGLDFPNLPYYLDDDGTKLTQSHVIMRHLARKHNLDGKTEQERARADLACATVYDYHMDYVRTIAYNPDHEKNRELYATNVADRLKALTAFLGDGQFLLGDHLSYADFVVYEFLAGQLAYNPDTLKDFAALEQFVKRVESLEAVKKYFSSPKAIKAPFNGGPAFVQGPYSELLAKKD